jgi:hypothetical protein
MGMDVYGIAPITPTGAYFRRNVWAWHPLWLYCEDSHPEIANAVQHAHTNDGDGLDADASRRLAAELFADVDSGAAAEYIAARALVLSAIPDRECSLCSGSGVRTDTVGYELLMPDKELNADQVVKLGRLYGWCNGCYGEGTVMAYERAYTLDINDINEFAVFLNTCGGFEIL